MKSLVLFLILVFVLSCSTEDESKQISSNQFALSVVENVQENANRIFSTQATRGAAYISPNFYETMEKRLESNMAFAIRNDYNLLLENEGYSELLGEAILAYVHGISFENIIVKYNIPVSELQVLANACACIDYLKSTTNSFSTRGRRRDSISCMVAVASSVTCTIGAMTIASPAGLGIFLVSKALATVSLAMCAS